MSSSLSAPAKARAESDSRSSRSVLSPGKMLWVVAACIFLAEALVMLILPIFQPLPRGVEALLDSSILMLILLPVYLYIYRPFWEERQLYQRQIQFLSQQLLIATEEERKRITHELHDECGQTLTALQFGMQTLKKRLAGTSPDVDRQVEQMISVTAQLTSEIRELTGRLRPAVLDQFGLLAALRWQFEEFGQNYPDIQLDGRLFRETDLTGRLEPSVEDALYRICQEALTNIAKHAGASRVSVHLWLEKNTLLLSIADNGCGFDLKRCWEQEAGACGIGLLGMRERVANLGGILQIDTSPGQGTSIRVSFPLLKEA